MLQHNLGAVLGVVVPVVLALAVVLVAVPLGLVPVLALERVFLACEDLAAAQSGLAVASKTEHDMKPQLYVEYIPPSWPTMDPTCFCTPTLAPERPRAASPHPRPHHATS